MVLGHQQVGENEARAQNKEEAKIHQVCAKISHTNIYHLTSVYFGVFIEHFLKLFYNLFFENTCCIVLVASKKSLSFVYVFINGNVKICLKY